MDDILKDFFGEPEENKEESEVKAEEVAEAASDPSLPEMPEMPEEKTTVLGAPEIPEAAETPSEFTVPFDFTAPPVPEEPEATPVPEEPKSAVLPPVMPKGTSSADEVFTSLLREEQPAAAPQEPVYTPLQPQEPVQAPPYSGFGYAQPTDQRHATYYQPPVQEPPYQAPPVFNPAGQHAPHTADAPVVTAKKKKSKAPWIIALIVILCICVAGAGIKSAVDKYKISGNKTEEKTTSSNPLDDFLNGDDDDDDDTTNDSDDAQASVQDSDEAAKKDSKGNLTVAGVAAENKDSCVGITVYTDQQSYDYFNFYGMPNQQSGEKVASGEGSGVIMSESDGKTYIMTCAHVIADGSSFTVTLDNDKTYDAKMVGYDSQTDIGVLVIDAKGLKVAEFGNSKDIEVGEDCVAIGCPGGLQFKNSVTKGIVSALDVPVSSSIGYNNECIQVDAAINPGNSGGALFNMQGQVIGINSSKIASTEYEGMGFAVPSNTAVETANSLIKNGYVKGRAKLGISYNTLQNYTSANAILSELAQRGFEDAEGTMVIQEINEDSDLNGKVQQYDMIVAVNGETLTSVDILTSVLASSKPGDTVKLTIARINNNSLDTFEISCKLVEAKE